MPITNSHLEFIFANDVIYNVLVKLQHCLPVPTTTRQFVTNLFQALDSNIGVDAYDTHSRQV